VGIQSQQWRLSNVASRPRIDGECPVAGAVPTTSRGSIRPFW
jgi:hypothetical protein